VGFGEEFLAWLISEEKGTRIMAGTIYLRQKKRIKQMEMRNAYESRQGRLQELLTTIMVRTTKKTDLAFIHPCSATM
jgi:hypothetical protein